MKAAPEESDTSTSQRRSRSLQGMLPGLLLTVAVAASARLLHILLPATIAEPVGEVIVAVALGVAVANLAPLPEAVAAGVKVCVTTVLRAAIVLLGARLALGEVLAIGADAVALIVVLMLTALGVAHLLARVTGTPAKVASLVGVGVSVCGNTAIVATAPAIGASDDDVATAITVNTLFGMLAVFVYPILGGALQLDPLVFGTWAGTAVNDTSQVVAVGFAYGAVAGQLATTIKLARNALMGFVIVAMTYLHRTPAAPGARGRSPVGLLRKSFPTFVLGFLAMAVANSLGVLDTAAAVTGVDVHAVLATAARWLLLVALAAVGLSASAAGLRRAGWRPFAVGLGAATVTSATSLALVTLLGPAGR